MASTPSTRRQRDLTDSLIDLHTGGKAGKCPVCFASFNTDPNAPSSIASLCYTPCVHAVCLGCAQQQVLSNGVDQAARRGVPRDRAVALANDGRLAAPCVLCRREYVVRDCVLVTEPPRAPPPAPEIEEDDGDEPCGNQISGAPRRDVVAVTASVRWLGG